MTAPTTDFTYAGMFHNADSGLDLTLYRAYDPVAGRWLSRDPLGEASNPAGNLYPYVANDPLVNVDPTGLSSTGPGCGRNIGECLLNCIKQHYLGEAAAAATIAAGARILPYGQSAISGGTGGTSIASIVLRRIFPKLLKTGAFGTKVLGGVLGRAVPYVGWGLAAYDVGAIGVCTAQCMSGD